MGSSTSCSFVLTPTGKPFYWTGETIFGHVVLTLDNSVTVKSVNLNMVGQRVDEQTRQSLGSNSTTETLREDFFVQNHPLRISASNGISYSEVSD